MDGEKTGEVTKVKSTPLLSTYATYKDMYDNNIIYSFKGIVTADLVSHVLNIMGDTFEEDKSSKKLEKKVSNVMVECLTNVYADEETADDLGYDPSALLMVKRVGTQYHIITCNNIPNRRVRPLKKFLDKINLMDQDILKEFHHDTLNQTRAEDETEGFSNLGIIDLARKSKNQLNYNFKYINQQYSFFSLEATITKAG